MPQRCLHGEGRAAPTPSPTESTLRNAWHRKQPREQTAQNGTEDEGHPCGDVPGRVTRPRLGHVPPRGEPSGERNPGGVSSTAKPSCDDPGAGSWAGRLAEQVSGSDGSAWLPCPGDRCTCGDPRARGGTRPAERPLVGATGGSYLRDRNASGLRTAMLWRQPGLRVEAALPLGRALRLCLR